MSDREFQAGRIFHKISFAELIILLSKTIFPVTAHYGVRRWARIAICCFSLIATLLAPSSNADPWVSASPDHARDQSAATYGAFTTSTPCTQTVSFKNNTVVRLSHTCNANGVVLAKIPEFVVGFIWTLLELVWQFPLAALAVSVLVRAILRLRLGRAAHTRVDDQPRYSSDPRAFIGRSFTLQRPIVDGAGILTAGGSLWRVTGSNCAAGTRITVLSVEGTLLIVDPVEVEMRGPTRWDCT